jgi:endonuclease/exonuclease/phosphatase family metal-dependent hydrolase
MRVATRNTNGKSADVVADNLVRLRKSVGPLDLVVLTETCQPPDDLWNAASAVWCGTDLRRGVAVFSFVGEARLASPWQPTYVQGRLHVAVVPTAFAGPRWAIPVEIESGDGPTLHVLAIWADNTSNDRPATQAIRDLRSWLAHPHSLVLGDFNNHRVWDHKRLNEKDHARSVEELGSLGLLSTFHVSHGRFESRHQDDRDHPTFWMYNSVEKPHHIDFVYAPASWIRDDPSSVVIGGHTEYAGDHAPVVATTEVRA